MAFLKGMSVPEISCTCLSSIRRRPFGGFRYHFRGATFDVVALNHVHQSTVLEQPDARRAGRVRQHELSCTIHGFAVDTGESGGEVLRQFVVLQGELDTGAHGACGTTADAVDHNEGGSCSIQRRINVLWRQQFFYSGLGEVGFHRGYEFGWVHGIGFTPRHSVQWSGGRVRSIVRREWGLARRSSRRGPNCFSGTQ